MSLDHLPLARMPKNKINQGEEKKEKKRSLTSHDVCNGLTQIVFNQKVVKA